MIFCIIIQAKAKAKAKAKMKTITLNGIPYSVNDKNELFLYSSEPAICVGSYDSNTQKVSLVSNWKSLSEPFLTKYRKNLKTTTQDALEKAIALQNS